MIKEIRAIFGKILLKDRRNCDTTLGSVFSLDHKEKISKSLIKRNSDYDTLRNIKIFNGHFTTGSFKEIKMFKMFDESQNEDTCFCCGGKLLFPIVNLGLCSKCRRRNNIYMNSLSFLHSFQKSNHIKQITEDRILLSGYY